MGETGSGFDYDDETRPAAFIQWKNTDVCFDFVCACGEDYHFNGFFAYYVECPKCSTTWQMPVALFPRKTPRYPSGIDVCPQMLDQDDLME